MNIEGSHKIEAPQDRVFAALVDPAVLEKSIPGCQQMEKTGENQYQAKLTVGVGPVKGIFTATVSLEDITAPTHYTLVVEGKGQPGFVKGSGALDLTPDGDGTSIHYSGEVHVGGVLASVGQRMIVAAANMLAGKFFASLETEAKTYSTAAQA